MSRVLGSRVVRGLVQWGCEVDSMGFVSNSMMMEHSHVDKHGKVASCPSPPIPLCSVPSLPPHFPLPLCPSPFPRLSPKLIDSILGHNSGVSEGECTSSLVGPFVGFHHQSLLIASLWPEGKGNVGYGANVGSNHTGKANDQVTTAHSIVHVVPHSLAFNYHKPVDTLEWNLFRKLVFACHDLLNVLLEPLCRD